jgi:asparagine synthase (glutamine-hydrolysing)
MCGLCGFTGHIENGDTILQNMMDKIIHRGPDSDGRYIGPTMRLGYRRLSIIDLEGGDQPMYNEDGTLALVFNGEIYNYQSLREELISLGHVFTTRCDTEVILHGYEEYGEKILDRLRGMFAFLIYDIPKDAVFAARDPFGIKPFYYAIAGGQLIFASEIKAILQHPAILKKVNEKALENYLTFQYSVLPETFFQGIYKLMPAHYLRFVNGQLDITRYWQAAFKPEADKPLETAVNEINGVMADSINMHKVSDVEVGAFLSGGVDSSYIVSRFNGDKTFTVGFDYEKYSEIEYARQLSDKVGIGNYNKTITTGEYWDILPKVQYHMDEPLADASAVALYFVSNVAARHVKVALSGEGADEFFGGYNIYKEPLDLQILTALPPALRKLLGKLASLIPFAVKGKSFFIRGSKNVEERFIGNANIFSRQERQALLKNPGEPAPAQLTRPFYDQVKHLDDITKMQFIDIHFWLVGDILLKADKMSMANSLEVRVPFLDKEVFRVASTIPTPLRVNKNATKYAFRLAARAHMPEETSQRKKLGFPVPIRIWLRDEKYYGIVKEAFTSEAAARFFHTDRLVALLDRHKAGKADYSRKIWTVYMFLVWHKVYFE